MIYWFAVQLVELPSSLLVRSYIPFSSSSMLIRFPFLFFTNKRCEGSVLEYKYHPSLSFGGWWLFCKAWFIGKCYSFTFKCSAVLSPLICFLWTFLCAHVGSATVYCLQLGQSKNTCLHIHKWKEKYRRKKTKVMQDCLLTSILWLWFQILFGLARGFVTPKKRFRNSRAWRLTICPWSFKGGLYPALVLYLSMFYSRSV
jgi:hypothetical protein